MVLLVEYGQLGTVKLNLNATCCRLWTSVLHEACTKTCSCGIYMFLGGLLGFGY